MGSCLGKKTKKMEFEEKFDQMIRDEDNRLEHFKATLKLQDKALYDRTKDEFAWLEIQKKQLRDNGQLNDITIIKMKQRGLIVKLAQESNEMQRLKLAHKQAAKERKNALRKQKNIIKQQLSSTDHIPSIIVYENVLVQSDLNIPSDVEVISEILTASTDETNKNVITLKDESETSTDLDLNVDEIKSFNLKESSVVQTKTLSDDQISDKTSEVKSSIDQDNDETQSEKFDHYSDIKSTILSNQELSKLPIKSENKSITDENSNTLIEDNTSPLSEINSKLSDKESVVEKTINSEIKSSLPEESEILKSTVSEKLNEESINAKSKLERLNIINTDSLSGELNDYNSKSHDTEMKNIESEVEKSSELKSRNETTDYISESGDQSIVHELQSDSNKYNKTEIKKEITDYSTKESEIIQNIQAEISTPRDSDPYYQTDFAKTDYTSDTQTKDFNDETEVDYEKDLSISDLQENTETIKSSIIFDTENESATIIESPKSDQSKVKTKSKTKDNSGIFESDKNQQL